jgi:hypothetical protein
VSILALIEEKEVKLKFVLNTLEPVGEKDSTMVRTSQEIWQGEMDLPDGVLVMKVSVIAEGHPHPICDIPFSLTEGYWSWHAPEAEYGEEVERVTGSAFDEKGRKIQT